MMTVCCMSGRGIIDAVERGKGRKGERRERTKRERGEREKGRKGFTFRFGDKFGKFNNFGMMYLSPAISGKGFIASCQVSRDCAGVNTFKLLRSMP